MSKTFLRRCRLLWALPMVMLSVNATAPLLQAETLRRNQPEEVPLNGGRPLSVTLTNGERLVGTAATYGEGKLVVHSLRMGYVTVDWKDVAQISGREPTILTERDMAKIFGASTGSRSASESSAEADATAAASTSHDGLPSEPLGEKPEDFDSRLLFLRQSSVLLAPGQFDVEIGVSYRRDEKQSYIPEVNDETGELFAKEELRRELETRLGVRVGLSSRLEAFASLPLLYATEEETSGSKRKTDNEDFGIGDVNFGIKALLMREKEGRPEVVFSVNGLAPTGEDPYTFHDDVVPLGGGHWGLGASLTLIKSYDPIIIFGGVNYLYRFPEDALGTRIEPGHEFGYAFGLGFAVNEAVTMSAQIYGAYRSKTEVGGETLEDSDVEPISLRFGMTYSLAPGRYLDSFVSFGISDDAPSSIFGASMTQRF